MRALYESLFGTLHAVVALPFPKAGPELTVEPSRYTAILGLDLGLRGTQVLAAISGPDLCGRVPIGSLLRERRRRRDRKGLQIVEKQLKEKGGRNTSAPDSWVDVRRLYSNVAEVTQADIHFRVSTPEF